MLYNKIMCWHSKVRIEHASPSCHYHALYFILSTVHLVVVYWLAKKHTSILDSNTYFPHLCIRCTFFQLVCLPNVMLIHASIQLFSLILGYRSFFTISQTHPRVFPHLSVLELPHSRHHTHATRDQIVSTIMLDHS